VNDPDLLSSWRPGATRDRILAFLDAADSMPIPERVAYFDNDGTLWCERPSYVQLEFFLAVLGERIGREPAVAEREEFAALLAGDEARIGEIGLERIGLALAGLLEGLEPGEFDRAVRDFMSTATHRGLDRPMRATVYQPMLELIEALCAREFTVGIVTGGGTEFVRAVSQDLYGVPPELVVGTLIDYELSIEPLHRPVLRRTSRIVGEANEGLAKVTNIQSHLGRPPLFAAGNSSGDAALLDWAATGHPLGLALLVVHDDAAREYAYESVSGTLTDVEPITATAESHGWCQVSIADDWATVFPAT
jgi:phosphoglycolate phosphatase-like HAD superfamily hydrolase